MTESRVFAAPRVRRESIFGGYDGGCNEWWLRWSILRRAVGVAGITDDDEDEW